MSLISNKISGVRRKQALVSAGLGLSTVCALAIGLIAVEMLADWGIDWPWADGAGFSWGVRLVFLAIMVGVLCWMLIRRVVTPLVLQADEDTLALAIERFEPALEGRLIASVQLARPRLAVAGSSQSLARALIRQTEDLYGAYDFDRVISTRPLSIQGSASLLLLLVGLIVFILCEPGSGALMRRVFLSNDAVPRRTRVEVKTRDVLVPRGEPLTIIAEAHGIHPSTGQLEIHDGATVLNFSMEQDASSGQYLRKIDNVSNPFTYRVRLNDDHSDLFHVNVIDRPDVLSMQCVQIFPSYIGLPDQPHLPGDLIVVSGSRLHLTVMSNKALKQTTPRQFPFNHVHLSGSERDFPLVPGGADPKSAMTADVDGQHGIPLPPGTRGLSIFLVDEEGFETKDPIVYRVELVPDKPPKVKISTGDWQEELVTRAAAEHIEFSAVDDYGLGKLALRFVVNDGPIQERAIPFNGNPTTLRGRYDLAIASIPFPPARNVDDHPTIRYWLYAEDLNTVSTPDHQPGHGESEKFTLRVVSEQEKLQELMGRFGGITADQLGAISTEQQEGATSLGQVIIQGTDQPTTLPVATRP